MTSRLNEKEFPKLQGEEESIADFDIPYNSLVLLNSELPCHPYTHGQTHFETLALIT